MKLWKWVLLQVFLLSLVEGLYLINICSIPPFLTVPLLCAAFSGYNHKWAQTRKRFVQMNLVSFLISTLSICFWHLVYDLSSSDEYMKYAAFVLQHTINVIQFALVTAGGALNDEHFQK